MAYATQTQSLSDNVFAAVSTFFAELSKAAERRRVYKTTYAGNSDFRILNFYMLIFMYFFNYM